MPVHFRIFLLAILFLFCLMGFACNLAPKEIQVQINHAGWTLTADEAKGILSISHDSLGMVLQQLRLNVQSGQDLKAFETWQTEVNAGNQLVINTIQPKTIWVFRMDVNVVMISCTSADAVLTAAAPSTADRVVARVLDPAGVPVSWVGTDEAVHSFGGKETRNPSFLPARNPEVYDLRPGTGLRV